MPSPTLDIVRWLDDLKAAAAMLKRAQETWPAALLRTARKNSKCDNHVCRQPILQHERYIDPGDANPERAGGFGGFRYCLRCGGGEPR